MTSVRDYRTEYRNVVRIMSASLIGKPFKFEYRSAGLGGDRFVALYDGNKMVNCKFGVTADGAEDKSVVIVPMNYIKIPPTNGAVVKRTFGGTIIEVESILPFESGDYESFAGITGTGSADDIESLKKEMSEMSGSNPDSASAQTPQLDSNKEIQGFLEGYDNTQKLKDVMPKPMTDEEYQAIRERIK